MRGNKKNLRGFTLTEILVTTAIIIILSGLVIANSGAGQRQLALSRSANKLAQDLRKAQEMAMSAKECPIDKCGGPPAIVPPRYGIEFNENSDNYFLFADLNDNGRYEPSDATIETMNVEKGVIIAELWTTTPPAPLVSSTNIWVAFKPPDPLTTIRNPAVNRSEAEIILKVGGQSREVIVNEAGLIYVE